MEIKQKHRKHALRKAVTAAVLAGTAFSSLGGFAGAVTTVKAEEDTLQRKLNEKFQLISLVAEIKASQQEQELFKYDEKELLDKLRRLISSFSTSTLNDLVDQLDPGSVYYNSELKVLNDFYAFNSDRFDWRRNGISLISVIVEEIKSRVLSNEDRAKEIKKKTEELKDREEKIKKLSEEKEKIEKDVVEKQEEINKKEQELIDKEAELKENKDELIETVEDLDKAKDSIEEKEAKVKDLSEKLDASRKEHEALANEFAESQKGYEKELADKHNALGEAEKRNADLEAGNKELKENLEMAEGISDDLQKKVMKAEQEMKEISAQLEAEKEALEAEKAKLAEAKEANDKLTEERDAAKKEAEKVPELEAQVEKLVEEITAAKKEVEELQAKAEGLEKDFEAVKTEKEALEAEIAKLKEDHQKEVDALNALLADKEKMLKNLQDQLDKAKEEAMKNEQMSQDEKAKLQAELDKAKQELADKIKDMPNKVAPQAEGKANAGQAAPNQNQNNQAQANQAKNANNLPSTGDKPVNPLLVASGLSLMIGAGAFVYAGKRKKG